MTLKTPPTLFYSKFCTAFFKMEFYFEKPVQYFELKRIRGAPKGYPTLFSLNFCIAFSKWDSILEN